MLIHVKNGKFRELTVLDFARKYLQKTDSYQTIFSDFIHFRTISKTYISFNKDIIMSVYVWFQ